jgi:glutamate racemase
MAFYGSASHLDIRTSSATTKLPTFEMTRQAEFRVRIEGDKNLSICLYDEASMTTLRPSIGVFDSGFGGLTVLKALLKLVPQADYLYFGDTARLPYGSKSVETVARYAVEAARFLEQKGAQMLVIACNTATALALDQITAAAKVPVVGVVEPGAERAAASSTKKKVVVIGTEATVSSHAYRQALQVRGVQAHEKACPLFVPLVEEGWNEQRVTEEVASIYLREAFAEGFEDADVLLLGCTHYPLIKPVLHKVAPAHVTIVDSAEATADAVEGLLRRTPLPDSSRLEGHQTARVTFFATDSVEKFRRLGPKFLGHPVEDVQHVDLKE